MGPDRLVTLRLFYGYAYQPCCVGRNLVLVKEEEQAVVCTFGSPQAVTTPGLHFKIPFIQTVEKVSTTINGFSIGYNSTGAGEEAMMIASDYNFLHVDFYAEYRVTDPVKARLLI